MSLENISHVVSYRGTFESNIDGILPKIPLVSMVTPKSPDFIGSMIPGNYTKFKNLDSARKFIIDEFALKDMLPKNFPVIDRPEISQFVAPEFAQIPTTWSISPGGVLMSLAFPHEMPSQWCNCLRPKLDLQSLDHLPPSACCLFSIDPIQLFNLSKIDGLSVLSKAVLQAAILQSIPFIISCNSTPVYPDNDESALVGRTPVFINPLSVSRALINEAALV